MSRATTTCRAVAAALAAVTLTAGPALADPEPTVPPDVAAVLDDVLETARAGDAGAGADFSGPVRADHVREVFQFSIAFVQGEPTNEPVITTHSWVASIHRGDEALGTLLIRRPDGGPAEPAGFSGDVVLGSVLGTLSATELVIDDAPHGGYYALDGATVRPLDDGARQALPEPADLSVLKRTLAEQYAAEIEETTVDGYPSALTLSLMGMTLALLAGASLAIHGGRRRRQLTG
jgi:hypothetical protein